MSQMLLVHRFLLNCCRNFLSHFCQQSFVFHQPSHLTRNLSCDAAFVEWSCVLDLMPVSLQRIGHPGDLCGHCF